MSHSDLNIYTEPPLRRERGRRGPGFMQRTYDSVMAFAENLAPWAHFPVLALSALMLAMGVATVFFTPLGFLAGAWFEAAVLLTAGLIVTGVSGPVFFTVMRKMAGK